MLRSNLISSLQLSLVEFISATATGHKSTADFLVILFLAWSGWCRYPQGYNTSGHALRASCLLMTGLPTQARVADGDCEPLGSGRDSNGHRLGSDSHIAVYRMPCIKYNQACKTDRQCCNNCHNQSAPYCINSQHATVAGTCGCKIISATAMASTAVPPIPQSQCC